MGEEAAAIGSWTGRLGHARVCRFHHSQVCPQAFFQYLVSSCSVQVTLTPPRLLEGKLEPILIAFFIVTKDATEAAQRQKVS